MRRRTEPVSTEIDPDRNYTPAELDEIATQMLRDDRNTEMCQVEVDGELCGRPGLETGEFKLVKEEKTVDDEGNPLVVKWPQLACEKGHTWYAGEGKRKGIGGENPILFQEHFDARKRREIYTTEGTPDPNIVSGIYNRTHPKGRKQNTDEQRKRHGASFFR